MSSNRNKLTASQCAKAAGLKNLNQVCELTRQSSNTLRNWSENKPELFEIVLLGCIAKLNKGTDEGDK